MGSRRVRSTLVAGAALCATAIAGVGAADGFRAETTAEIDSGGPQGAQGTVSSPRAACVPNRTVTLYRVSEEGPPQAFGTDTTDAQGNWAVSASLFAGEYYVTVEKKNLRKPATSAKKKRKKKKICKATTSERKRL
jgi:hypothetical protein